MQETFWQREKKQLAAILENKLVGSHKSISYGFLANQTLPEILKVSLRNQAKLIFKNEKPLRIIQSSRFDFSAPALKEELGRLRDLFINNVNFGAEEVRKIINFSVNLGYDVVARPHATIRSMLFQTSSVRTRKDILSILNSLGDDLIFVNSLIEFLTSESREEVTNAHFDQMCLEVQASLYGEHPISAIISDLTVLEKFIREITTEKRILFPADIINGVLVERKLNSFSHAFAREAKTRKRWSVEDTGQFLEREMISGGHASNDVAPAEIQMLEEPESIDLEDLLPKEPESPAQPAEEKVEPAPEAAEPRNLFEKFADQADSKPSEPESDSDADISESKLPSPEAPPADADTAPDPTSSPPGDSLINRLKNENRDREDIKSNSRLVSRETSKKLPPESALETLQRQKTPKDLLDTDTRLMKQAAREDFDELSTDIIRKSQIEAQPPGPYPSLSTIIDYRTERTFIRKLFGRDEVLYAEFLEKLEKIERWKDAKAIMDSELEKRGQSLYSREAVRLSDLLFSRYFSRGKM